MMVQYTVFVLALALCSVNAFTVNIYDDDVESTNNPDTLRVCQARLCNRVCKRLGFSEGVCVDGNCKCERKEEEAEALGKELQNELLLETQSDLDDFATEVRRCSLLTCARNCRSVGLPGGRCVRDRCVCYAKRQAVSDPPKVESCDYRVCDQLCRRLGFPGGACVGDRCKCDNFKQSIEENEIAIIDSDQALGNQQGLDVGEENREENEVPTTDKHEVLNDVQELIVGEENEGLGADVSRAATVRASCDCVQSNCNLYCFKIRYFGGICVTGQCRCYR